MWCTPFLRGRWMGVFLLGVLPVSACLVSPHSRRMLPAPVYVRFSSGVGIVAMRSRSRSVQSAAWPQYVR